MAYRRQVALWTCAGEVAGYSYVALTPNGGQLLFMIDKTSCISSVSLRSPANAGPNRQDHAKRGSCPVEAGVGRLHRHYSARQPRSDVMDYLLHR